MTGLRQEIDRLRNEFFHIDVKNRDKEFDDFRSMTKKIYDHCFEDDLFVNSGRGQEQQIIPKSSQFHPDGRYNGNTSNTKDKEFDLYKRKSVPVSDPNTSSISINIEKEPEEAISRGSLENLYDKIKDLKSEFQHVEKKMRSAVEALPSRSKRHGTDNADWDSISSKSWRRSPEFSDIRSVRSEGYYPGKFTDRINNDYNQTEVPFSTTQSGISSSASPRQAPVRGSTVGTDIDHPDYIPQSKSPVPESVYSDVSTPTYPFARSPVPSSYTSPEPSCHVSDYDSDTTVRSQSPSYKLQHSETYIQIPVVCDSSDKNKVEVARFQLPEWEIVWFRAEVVNKFTGNEKSLPEEKFGYKATLYIYHIA